MKYTIDYDDTGRDIDGPFNIIGSSDDLRDLAEQILAQVGPRDQPSFSYGTVLIRQRYNPSTNINRHLPWRQGARLPDEPAISKSLAFKEVF